ncbi:hypothetical protein BDY17DRAFT_188723 [Neohortaea acidophila]|uniref:Uncharacterized protein n=1 Tax=Neohortaea acidophila TaxID=245834 RepID=A0A6A6PMV5_9PEZI|nr:uncharacterized protein BDY17DRAFT_188723 [Neohortaea acidophila]KAF2481438.1 hypothetical protein BDY17DRAFT_188723 [Neohortaea acidophila]
MWLSNTPAVTIRKRACPIRKVPYRCIKPCEPSACPPHYHSRTSFANPYSLTMPLFHPTIAAICIYIGVASASLICPTNVNFKLEAAGKFLTPGSPCGQYGCYAFFSVDITTGFEYTIAEGTTSLMIAQVPAGSQTPAGLYVDAHDYVGDQVLAISFQHGPPVNMNCTIVPTVSLDGLSCNLECQGRFNDGATSDGQSIDPKDSNLWFLGGSKHDTKVTVQVVYT